MQRMTSLSLINLRRNCLLTSNIQKIKYIPCVHQQCRLFSSTISEKYSNIFNTISDSSLVSYGQSYFELLHDTSHLPWWSTIIISTFLVRSLITLPLSIYQNKIFAKVENIQLEMPKIVKQLKYEAHMAIKNKELTELQAKHAYLRSVKKQWRLLIERDNCHPFKASILILIQLPLWICLSLSLRNMCYLTPLSDTAAHILYLQLSLGGFLWIPNLTIPDSSWIIPVFMAITNLSIIEMQNMMRSNKPKTKFQTYITNFLRGITVVMIPVAASVPSCMSLYWTASSLCGLSCNLILLSPKVRRFVGIPHTNTEIQQPYLHLKQQIIAKFSSKKTES